MDFFKQVNQPVRAWQFNGELPPKDVLNKASEHGYNLYLVYGRLHLSCLIGHKDTQVASNNDWLVSQIFQGRLVFWIEPDSEFKKNFIANP